MNTADFDEVFHPGGHGPLRDLAGQNPASSDPVATALLEQLE